MGQILHAAPQRQRQPVERYKPENTGQALWHQPQGGGQMEKRTSVADLLAAPKQLRSTVLSVEEAATIAAFRKHTLLPLDDCNKMLAAQFLHNLMDAVPYHIHTVLTDQASRSYPPS